MNNSSQSLFFVYVPILSIFQVRKERQEYNIAELKVQISRLEDALAAETKRRVDATTQIDDQARQEIYEMEERLRKQLEEDNAKLQARISSVEDRLAELEERWSLDAAKQMEAIQQKAHDFGKTLDQLQQEQDIERKARLRREGSLLQQVEHHAKEFETRWNAERQDRLDQIATLERQLQEREEQRGREQSSFQRRVEEEIELLRTELDLEVQEREAQDEQIVAALNRYTQQLQESLSILSSD